jgi:excisionase family DNA binding protein
MRTPRPMPGESPIGYLLRLSEENGYETPAVVVGMVERSSEYQVTMGWDFGKLRDLLGPYSGLPVSFGYGRHGRRRQVSVLLQSERVSSAHVGQSKSRICTQCIEELGYAPLAWDLKAFVACPVHGHMMLKHCGSCGRRIRWQRPGLLVCKCGADLRATRTMPATRELVALMEILDAKVSGKNAGFIVATTCGMPIDELMACDLDVLCKVIVMLAKLISWMESHRRTPRSGAEVSERLPEVARVLSAWPFNYSRFCADWHRNSVSRGSKTRIFQTNFHWLFVRLYKNLKARKRQTRFLIREAIAYAVQRWDRSPVRVSDRTVPSFLLRRRYGSYSDAAKVLGWTRYTTQRWLKRGRLPARAVGTKRCRPIWLVDLGALQTLKFSRRSEVGSREGGPLLGLSHMVYQALRRSGHIQHDYLVRKAKGVAIEDLESFEQSILQRALPKPVGAAQYALRSFMNAPVPISRKLQLLCDIRDGQMNIYLKGKPSIKNLFMDVDLLAEFRAARRASNPTPGVYETAARFGLNYHEVRAIELASRKRTGAEEKDGCALLNAGKFEQFLKNRVPLRHVASELHVTWRFLYAALNRKLPHALERLSAGCIAKRNGIIYATFLKRWALDKARQIGSSPTGQIGTGSATSSTRS